MMPSTPLAVSCPACGKATVFAQSNPWRPFCSETCKLVDLGQWAQERYRIPDQPQDAQASIPADE